MLELVNITKKYEIGSEEIFPLRRLCLHVREGDFVSIIGASGSGKTTLMNILGCMDVSDRGTYLLGGKNVSEMTHDELAATRSKRIGFVFQSFCLLEHLNALENVVLPLMYAGMKKSLREQVALQALESVGLSDRISHKPRQLSGGQKQRVAIARALCNRPDIILADEPTGNLDGRAGSEIMDIFKRLNKEGKTVILITHEPGIAQMATTCYRLENGGLTLQAGKEGFHAG